MGLRLFPTPPSSGDPPGPSGPERRRPAPHTCALAPQCSPCLCFNVSEAGCVPQPVAPGELRRLKLNSGSYGGGAGCTSHRGLFCSLPAGHSPGEPALRLHPPPVSERPRPLRTQRLHCASHPRSFSPGDTDKYGTTSHGEDQRAFFCKRPDSKRFQLHRGYLTLPRERARTAGAT